jgi:hypothetical protein
LDEVYGLSKILDLDRLVKEWNYGYSVDMSPAQGNNNGGSGSSIKGGDSGKGSNNGGSGGLKVSDFKLDTELHIH